MKQKLLDPGWLLGFFASATVLFLQPNQVTAATVSFEIIPYEKTVNEIWNEAIDAVSFINLETPNPQFSDQIQQYVEIWDV